MRKVKATRKKKNKKRIYQYGTGNPIMPPGMQVRPMDEYATDDTQLITDPETRAKRWSKGTMSLPAWNKDYNDPVGTGLLAVGSVLPQEGNKPSIGKSALSGAGMGMKVAGPWGAVAGAIIGGIGGTLGQKKHAQAEADERERIRKIEEHNAKIYDRGVLANYPEEGYGGNTIHYGYGGRRLYKMGGRVDPMTYGAHGGRVRPIATGMVKAEGNTHAQGGINLPGNIEVEDQEVAANVAGGQVWFSDKLKTDDGKTFAETAEKIAKVKRKSELGINSVNRYERGTAERNLATTDAKILELEQEQNIKRSQVSSSTGGIKAEFGTELGEVAANTLPYIDNLVNTHLINRTPKIPAPRLYKPIPINTDVTVNAELAEIEQQQRNAVKGLESYTTDPGTLRANVIGMHAATVGAKNKVFQYRQNKERELQNQDVMNRQQVYNANVDKLAAYDTANFQRDIGIQERKSQNVANLAEDAQFQIQQSRLEKRDKLTHEYLKLRFRESGVGTHEINSDLDLYMNGELTDKQFDERMAAHQRKFEQSQYSKAVSAADAEKKRKADIAELARIKKEIKRQRKLGKVPPLERRTETVVPSSNFVDPYYMGGQTTFD